MENKRTEHISEKELDHLLNETFLKLDFETNPGNKEALAAISKHVMRKSTFFTAFTSYRLNALLLSLSVFMFLISFYRYIEPLQKNEDRKSNAVPNIGVAKRDLLPVRTTIEQHLIKNNSPVLTTAALSHIETKKRVVKKKKPEYGFKKLAGQEIPDTSARSEKMNSLAVLKDAEFVSDSALKVTDTKTVDSTNNVPKKPVNGTSSVPIARVVKPRPVKKIIPSTASKKSRRGWNKRGKMYGGNGTFILKGNKYRKSRRM